MAQRPSANEVLGLQRVVGNQAVSRMLSGAAPRPGLRAARLSRAVLQRALELNNTLRATPEDVRADLGGDFDAMRDTVEALISVPAVVKLPTADALRQVHAFWTNPARPRPASRDAWAAGLQLLSHGAWTITGTEGGPVKKFSAAFNDPRVLANLAGLGDFLRANPNVVANLEAAGVGWKLMSTHSQIKGFGGAAVIDDRIHIDATTLAENDPDKFVRTAVHEAGHATFQRMLLITGEGWTETANTGGERPDERALDADGRKFYDAWLVLRKQPKYFFVADMAGTTPEAKGSSRQQYLARQFTEFCADSFMHIALKKNELEAHVKRVPNWFTDVKRAWESALSILKKYEPAIVGRQARARPDEAKVRDRAYELYQRSGGGLRSHEETEANYYEALRQVAIEERAHQIWKLRRGDPVANYYLAERQIA